MAERRGIPTSTNSIRASRSVLNLLPQFAGLVVGFSGLAYVAGWHEASSYYQELGADWALPLLSPAQIMQASIWLISILALVGFISTLFLIQGNASQKGLRRWAITFLFLAAMAYVFSFALEGRLSRSSITIFAGATSIFWAISTGLTIGELIACLALSKLEWGRYHVFLLYFIVLYGLLQAPTIMGRAHAKLVGDQRSSSLPKVSLTAPGQVGDWRLVGFCGDKLLLVLLAEERKDRRFKLVSPEGIGEISVQGSK